MKSNAFFYVVLATLLLTGSIIVAAMLIWGLKEPNYFVNMGAWGDFFGGSLNPILTFLTFIGLLVTIALQRHEINLTRDEMKRSADALELQERAVRKQSFESTFFGMINLHNEIVNSIDLVAPVNGDVTRGRDCFRIFYTRLNKEYRDAQKSAAGKSDAEILSQAYEKFWKSNQLELGHYLRYLFNVVRFVDSSDQADLYHMRLLRSQLSDQELLVLFYNCTQSRGDKFRALAEKHALFNNLPTIRLLSPSHVALVSQSAF